MGIKHLQQIIIGQVTNPPTDVDVVKQFMRDLVEAIGMKRLIEPQAVYVKAVGNKGMTSCVLIETSHIAWHVWDEESPGLLQFDLYTCGDLVADQVLAIVKDFFGLTTYSMKVFDRAVELNELVSVVNEK
jgi:S-adenosylmethionine/arginine decarboxylase-like enzyme